MPNGARWVETSFGCSLYLGGSIIYMKTIAATPDPVEVGTFERGCDKGKKGFTCSKLRDTVTSLEARVF
ncbi:hypothetical protein PanWU01x14_110860 [Parasponia andersonii]|uniref:Uncharacterized protein n=1 Tax=Parasponia andersonii TaxID=3476 RepID=A0A2P5CYU2_PARAD|nr:hypothetical protein PanWU01x14_110860 [Parasponia andersonii]